VSYEAVYTDTFNCLKQYQCCAKFGTPQNYRDTVGQRRWWKDGWI